MRLGRTGRFVYGRRSLIFGLWAGDESLICLRRQSREQVRPLVLASFVRDQVLANFDCHMMQIALFAVNGDRIVRRVSYAVGLVYRRPRDLARTARVYQDIGKTRITVVEHANMPGPHDGLKYGRETVHSDLRRRSAGLSPLIQFARSPIVIRLKYLSNAGLHLNFAEPSISGNGREFAQFDDRRL